MRCLHEASQLIGRDHRYRPLTLAANDHDFPVVADAVKSRCQALSQIGICSFCHIDNRVDIVQVSCTLFQQFFVLQSLMCQTAQLLALTAS